MIKKLFYTLPLCALLTTLSVSCVKDNLREVEPLTDLGPDSGSEVTSLLFSVEPFNDESGHTPDVMTKTSISTEGQFTWAAGDFVGIYPDSGCQIYFSMEAGAGTSSAVFDGGGWSLKSTAQYWSYYPFQADYYLDKTGIKVSYPARTQNGNNDTAHLGSEDFMYTPKAGAVDGAVTFKYKHLSCILWPIVTLPAGTYSKIVISATKDIFATSGSYDLTAETPAIVGDTFTNQLTLNLDGVTFTEETKFTGYLMAVPVDVTDEPINVVIYSEDDPVYYYTYLRNRPWAAGSRHALECTELHRVVSSAESANSAFAAGETEVVFMEVPNEDVMDFVLPSTVEDVNIMMPTSEKDCTISLGYSSGNKPANITLQAPAGANVNLDTPNSTVTLNGAGYGTVISKTADNTLIVSEGVSVDEIKLVRGNVIVYGTVESFNTDDLEEGQHPSVYVYGTVADFIDDDDVDFIIPATSISVSESSLELEFGETAQLIAILVPENATSFVAWTTDNHSVATVSADGIITAVGPGTCNISAYIEGLGYASCSVTVLNEVTFTAVDLGLSVMWANCNLGASSPEGSGDYYAWGEISPKNNYDWTTYKWCSGSASSISKYCEALYDYDLERTNDDVAAVNLGDKWRMPTIVEANELITACTWTESEVNGVWGYTIEGPSGKSIFLPYSGYRSAYELIDNGTNGYYATATLDWKRDDAENCFTLSLSERNNSNSDVFSYSRALGFTIRPVYEEHHHVLPLKKISGVAPKTFEPGSKDYYYCKYCNKYFEDPEGTIEIPAPFIWKAEGGNGYLAPTGYDNDYVDLGLSVRWATCNLDASTPEGFGGYYAWGETTTKSSYTESTYKYCNGNMNHPSKYIAQYSSEGAIDNKTVLDPEDDAATAKLGNGWRTPTKEEWEELEDNTDQKAFTLNGIKGVVLTSKVSGFTDKQLFIPYAGYIWNATNQSDNSGRCMSSTLVTPNHAGNYCGTVSYGGLSLGTRERYEGQSVRPVKD